MTPQTQSTLAASSQNPKKAKHKTAFDGVIFDIDNVLVDTRRSYLEVIRWTVQIFLTEGRIPFFSADKKSLSNLLLSKEDVAQFKLLGGFNDDWDCCYGILAYLLSLPVKGRKLQNLKKSMNIKAFCKSIKTRPLGVSGIVKKTGRSPYLTIEKISRIFQEVYLGKTLFEKVERRPCLFWAKNGLVNKEKLIFRKSTLQRLKNLGVNLGITTGRSKFEALYALRRFGVQELFDAITTMDEIKPAEETQCMSLRKPHPFSLIETAKKIGMGKKFLYVGDLPDDILTASRAKKTIQVASAGFPGFSHSPKTTLEDMRALKADFILKKPSDLLPIVLRGNAGNSPKK